MPFEPIHEENAQGAFREMLKEKRLRQPFAGKTFIVGLDLGQQNDYSALSVLERLGDVYHLRHLERLPLGSSYVDQLDRVRARLNRKALRENTDLTLVIDQTGVGRPIFDMFRKLGMAIPIIGITITSGDKVTQPGPNEYHVPKKDFIGNLTVLAEQGKLLAAGRLPLVTDFKMELGNFRAKVSQRTGHASFEAWREGDKDDLVLSVALSAWYARVGQSWGRKTSLPIFIMTDPNRGAGVVLPPSWRH
jgi:hypothetical protein